MLLVCCFLASLLQSLETRAATVGADALVLVNSRSAGFADFQHFIQPFLDQFGVPYTVQDISTNAPGTNMARYALIVIGHKQLDLARTYLTSAAQSQISLAVSNGVGLVNFDNDLASGNTPRYQFIQDIFGFTYSSGGSATAITFPGTAPASPLHFISARHATNESIALRAAIALPGLTLSKGATSVALASTRPLLVVNSFGQGRAVQWASYDWMSYSVLGPFWGVDDLVWRGMVWAARKPFAMRSMPNFVTMRVDDVVGPFGWAHIANELGFKPFLALFVNMIDETEAADLRDLVTNGKATASIHSWDFSNSFFYWNHAAGAPWPDNVMSNNFYIGTQWHLNHGIPISKVVASHYSEIGLNAFAGLQAWGVEFFPIEIVPGNTWHTGVPWIMEGPYRLYQSGAGDSLWPLYYADFLTVAGHPEFNGVFFNQYTDVRDMTVPGGTFNCGEWCPDNDIEGSIARGTKILRRGLDGLALATLMTHDRYIGPITGSSDPSNVTSNHWRAILQGITNNLTPCNPVYVTLDYGCQYARALKTSRVISSDYDPLSGQLAINVVGRADLDTSIQVYLGADNSISNVVGTISAFTNGVGTNVIAAALPVAPTILQQPISRTNHQGTPATFSVAAVGTDPQFQWRKDGATLGDATNSTLALASVSGTDAGVYDVVVSNAYGAVTSGEAGLAVWEPLLIRSLVAQPGSELIGWSAIPGVSYGLQYKDALGQGSWRVASPASPAQSTNGVATNTARPTGQRFFRIFTTP